MATIGGLNIKLGLDAGELTSALAGADSAIGRFVSGVQQQFRSLEQSLTRIGAGMTAAVTLPFGLMSRSAAKTAGDFESAMNRVQAALRPLNTRQIERLRDAALTLGPSVGLSATEAAAAIETLGLAGMNAEAILGGGLQQTLTMARANLGDVEGAAGLATDVLRQFNLVSSDLTMVTQQVTGALDASKFGFDDFRLAIAQGGAVAGSAGISFQDFSAAIATTSAQFASGSDAGTSFKAFIVGLNNDSKEAQRVIEQLGLRFFDAQGQFLGLANAAEELRTKVGTLSDQSRNDALTTLFGTDGMRSAIGLMQAGREEFERTRDAIGQTDVGEKLAIQMQGLGQAMTDLGNASERLKIALGEAGLLAIFTALATAVGGAIGFMADLPQPFLTTAIAVGALAAAIGPLLLIFTKVLVPVLLMTGRLGFLGTALAALFNPVGLLVVVLTRLAVSLGLATAAANLAAASFARMLGPISLAIVALVTLSSMFDQNAEAEARLAEMSDIAGSALSGMTEKTNQLANASGAARQQILAQIQAMAMMARVMAAVSRARAVEARNAAQRDLAEENSSLFGGGFARWGRRNITGVLTSDQGMDIANRYDAEGARFEAAAQQGEAAMNVPAPGSTNITGLGNAAPRARGGGGGGGASGADRAREIEERDHRREMLVLQNQLAEARAREDQDAERTIQRAIELKERTREYRDLEYSAEEARAKAADDRARMDEAEQVARDRNVGLLRDEVLLARARVEEDWTLVDQLERQAEHRDLIERYRRQGLTLAQAEIEAESDISNLVASRAAARERENASRERGHAIELARLRGDRGMERALLRNDEIERRSRDYADRYRLDPEAARQRATAEVEALDEARMTGKFRDTFREGVMAAMEGDLDRWLADTWTDILSDALRDSLNSVADMLRELLKGLIAGSGGESGGGLSGILGGIARLFGGGGGGGGASFGSQAATNAWEAVKGSLPKFATGGSFEVGGRSGIDQNLVSFWATRGEMVNITKGESKQRPLSVRVVKGDLFDVIVDERAAGVAAPMAVRASRAGSADALSTLARRRARALPTTGR